MEIRIGSLSRDASEATGAALVIDVFRAFTTAAIAFDRGAERITLVAEVEEALEIRRNNPAIADILMGEVEAAGPRGLTTATRRTRHPRLISPARASCSPPAPERWARRRRERPAAIPIYVTSFVVAGATVQALLAEDPLPERVTILAMGDQGVNRSDEDEHCALYLRNRLEGRNPDPGGAAQADHGRRRNAEVLRRRTAAVSPPGRGSGPGGRPLSLRHARHPRGRFAGGATD